MKITLIFIGLLAALCGRAQTYVNYQLTHFTKIGATYTASTNIVVPANTLATMLNLQGNDNITGYTFDIQYGNNPVITLINPSQSEVQNVPMLGPATVTIQFTSSTSSSLYAGLLVKFETVNTTPDLQGYAVQPNGHSATVSLQKSSDLANWMTATNGVYAMTNRAEFYRLNFVTD